MTLLRDSSLPRRRRMVLVSLALAGASALFGTCLAFGQSASLASMRPTIAREYPEIRWITVGELDRALRSRSVASPRLVDARTRAEFEVSHLRGAIRIDPDHPDIAALGSDHMRATVVYCSVGYRSARITRELVHAGFGDTRNLEGGIFAWANRGLPVYRGRRAVRDVHPFDDTWGLMLDAELRTRVPR